MEEKESRRTRVVLLREAADAVLAPPRLVELSPDQELEAVRLLADLFARAARRPKTPELRNAA